MSLGGFFEIARKKQELKSIEDQIADSKNWADHAKLSQLNKKRRLIVQTINDFENLQNKIDESQKLLQIVKQEQDENYFKELKNESSLITKQVSELEIKSLLGEDNDSADAYLSIHSGAGGTEAQDWSLMLYRMYLRWIEKKQFQSETVSLLEGDSAGLKSVILKIKGLYSYGYLKGESGVHRLVRISPFDSNSRRHTSFASVFVWPEIKNDVDVQVKNEDLRIDTYRASGAGGQHVNKTDSAVRITHIPTGRVVQCQNQRSQYANKNQAMKMLKSILYQMEMDKRNQEKQKMESLKKANEWGSQIRSYILHPYRMVKDHRTNLENPQPDLVLDGDLDDFISAQLKKQII